MKWNKQQPDRDGLWLWRVCGLEGVGILLVDGNIAKELTMREFTMSPVIEYHLSYWNEAGRDIETYYIGEEE